MNMPVQTAEEYAKRQREVRAERFRSLTEYYYWFPDTFWPAYNAGTPIHWHPEAYPDSDNAMYIEIDDDKWQPMNMHIEYRVREGMFEIVVMNDYQCGESREFHAYVASDAESAQAVENRIYNDWEDAKQRQYIKYCEWVLYNEEDPLDEFFGVTAGSDRHAAYECRLEPDTHSNKVKWTGWRERDIDGWLNPYWAPFYLHHYLMASADSWFNREYFVYAEDIEGVSITWDNIIEELDLREEITVSSGGDWMVLTARIDYEVHNPNYYEKLRQAAQRAIEEQGA